MSNNAKRKKKKRGKKRKSKDLLSTSNENNNAINPRASKRRRTSRQRYDNTIQTLLTMPESDINELPASLKKHAVEMRKTRNSTQSVPPLQIYHNGDYSSDSSEEEALYEEPQMPVSHAPKYHSDTQEYNAPHTVYAYNPNASIKPSAPTMPHITRPTQQTTLLYDRQPMHTQPANGAMHYDTAPSSVPGHISMRSHNAVIRDKKRRKSGCFCKCGYLLLFCAILMLLPLIKSKYDGANINYCDSNAIIHYHCMPCPVNAVYCIGGKAKCKNSDMVDTKINKCVEISVFNVCRNVWSDFVVWVENGFNGLLNYYSLEMIKWQSIKEWKLWFKRLRSLSFVEFCKLYEMEVMITFFILIWNLPMFRCLIIFLWTRMVLPVLDGSDDKLIIVCLKLLSYFAPIMFSHAVWNKITALFT